MKLRIKRTNYFYNGPWTTIDKIENILQYQDENGYWQDVPKEEIEYVNLKQMSNH